MEIVGKLKAWGVCKVLAIFKSHTMSSEYLFEFLFNFTLCDEQFFLAMMKHIHT